MIEDHREWSFGKLLIEYMGEWVFFGMNGSFDKLPWSLRIEVRRIVSVLNAFTGRSYDPSTTEGKQEIIDAFEQGFNQRDNKCTDEQLNQLRELLPQIDDIFSEFENERPCVIDFYRYLFAAYQASYDYVTAFDDLVDYKYTDAFFVADAFKRKKIHPHIVEKVKIIFKGFNILLGDMCKQKFTTSELIDNYNYPNVEYEKLIEFNKKWCKFHGIQFKDFRKSKKYTDSARYSTFGLAE